MSKFSQTDIKGSEFYQRHLAMATQCMCDGLASEFREWMQTSGVPNAESPLEAAFTAWWMALDRIGMITSVTLIPQHDVRVEDKLYRLDFVLAPTGEFEDLIDHPSRPLLAVEFDGHEFHERTADQVTRRNQRDRHLSSAGWMVSHYSGSEMNRRPLQVCLDVFEDGYRQFTKAMRTLGFWQRRA